MLGGREAEAEVVVAVVWVVVVPIARRAVLGVVVPVAAPVLEVTFSPQLTNSGGVQRRFPVALAVWNMV